MSNLTLIQGISISVIGAIKPFVEQFPEIKNILKDSQNPASDWDFYMTVAGVGSYLVNSEIDKEAHKELIMQLYEFDKHMPEALNNFADFINDNKDSEAEIIFSVGYWVLWNIAQRRPDLRESKELAPALGGYIFKVVKELPLK